jgi:phosphoribosyl-dephospho-CoA transferase
LVNEYRVHELLRVEPEIASAWAGAPDWVSSALRRAPWVVVRRQHVAGAVAVGVRGTNRAERFAAVIEESEVREIARPGELISRIGTLGRLQSAFHEIARIGRKLGFEVHPIGSFGFELASAMSSTNANSDLDVLVKADGADRSALHALSDASGAIRESSGVRIDIEVTVGDYALALGELDSAEAVIVKSPFGPKLIACPF